MVVRWVWLVGAVLALLGELVHEIIENSEWVIQLYRDNSGTSGQYEGDSTQNIIGDLISALFGWYVTALLHMAGYPWLVVVWTVISEAFLIWYMRDCGLFICIQLICPIKVSMLHKMKSGLDISTQVIWGLWVKGLQICCPSNFGNDLEICFAL